MVKKNYARNDVIFIVCIILVTLNLMIYGISAIEEGH